MPDTTYYLEPPDLPDIWEIIEFETSEPERYYDPKFGDCPDHGAFVSAGTCHCGAYNFPHRADGGKCNVSELSHIFN